MEKNQRGVFCIEAMTTSEDFSSRETLEFLDNYLDIPTLFYPVRTRAKFIGKLKDWHGRDDYKYPILYLSCHGSDREIFVDDPRGAGYDSFDLRTISRVIEESQYSMDGSLIHFGACSTLAVGAKEIRKFFKTSEVTAISGYRKDVSWLESLSFELLFMDTLQDILINAQEEAQEGEGGVTADQMRTVRERLLDSRKCRGLVDALGFKIFVGDEFEV